MTRPRNGGRDASEKGKIVQVMATGAALIMIVVDQYTVPRIDPLFIWAMFGLAYGARPETINQILRGGR